VTGQAFGVSRVPVVKRQGFPAYDPRAIKGIGVTYATSPMGADHTAGYAIATNIMGVGGHVDPLKPDGQVELSRSFQVATAALDTIGYCLFISFAILDIPAGLEGVVESVSTFDGSRFSAEEFNQMGVDVLLTEKRFNEKAGFDKEQDRLPAYFYKESLPPHNTVFDVLDETMDTLFDFRPAE
jgi:aldehyde:ferredoxin oxidoreductase